MQLVPRHAILQSETHLEVSSSGNQQSEEGNRRKDFVGEKR